MEDFKMKFTRILALALACVMLALSMASCGGSAVTNVILKISVPSEENPEQSTDYFADGTIDLEVPGENPTVIDVLRVTEEPYDMVYDIEENANGRSSVKAIDDYATYTDEETGIYYAWHFTINGEIPDGHAGSVTVAEGDVIEYIFAPVEAE